MSYEEINSNSNKGVTTVKLAGIDDYREICKGYKDYNLVPAGYEISKKFANTDFLGDADCNEHEMVEVYFRAKKELLEFISAKKKYEHQSVFDNKIMSKFIDDIKKADKDTISIYDRLQVQHGSKELTSKNIINKINEQKCLDKRAKEDDDMVELIINKAIEFELIKRIGTIIVVSVRHSNNKETLEELKQILRNSKFPIYLKMINCNWPNGCFDFNEFPNVKYLYISRSELASAIANKSLNEQYAYLDNNYIHYNQLVGLYKKTFIPVKNELIRNLIKKLL